jgi:hypothetical protein
MEEGSSCVRTEDDAMIATWCRVIIEGVQETIGGKILNLTVSKTLVFPMYFEVRIQTA